MASCIPRAGEGVPTRAAEQGLSARAHPAAPSKGAGRAGGSPSAGDWAPLWQQEEWDISQPQVSLPRQGCDRASNQHPTALLEPGPMASG